MEEKQGRRREGRRTGWEERIMDGKKVKKSEKMEMGGKEDENEG